MKRIVYAVVLFGLVGCGRSLSQSIPAGHLAALSLPKNSSEVLEVSMRLFDASYDSQAHLVLHPNDGGTHVRGKYMVRESSWYALGLLMRHRGDDDARARGLLSAVLDEFGKPPG